MKKLIYIFFILIVSLTNTSFYPMLPWEEEYIIKGYNNGYDIEDIEQGIIIFKDKLTSYRKYLNIKNIQQNYFEKNMQIFDLVNEDTNLYTSKYKFYDTIFVGGILGYPLIYGDFNNNNNLDVSGSYKIEQDLGYASVGIAELKHDSTFIIKKVYQDSIEISIGITDVDQDNLIELNTKSGGQMIYNYECTVDTSYPDSLFFKYRMFVFGGEVASETFADLDGDNFIDLIHAGDDKIPPASKIYVAEYDSSLKKYKQVYSHQPSNWSIAGFSVADFDQDGLKEFVAGSVEGDVYVFENSGNDSYAFIYTDTLSTPNAYLNCATNDIDKNGKPEFFIGGSSYYHGVGGTKVYWFEADGNNNYFKKHTFFLLGTDVLGTTELYNYDVNNDGVDDLVFAFGSAIVILIWNIDGFFDLYYLDWLERFNQEIQSVNIFDLYNSDKPELIISFVDYERIPRIRSEIFINNTTTSIPNQDNIIDGFNLLQNYPNPFNSETRIKFILYKYEKANLVIYDLIGKEVIRILDDHFLSQGEYEFTWNGINKNGKEVSSGIYIYQLETKTFTQSKKMVIVK